MGSWALSAALLCLGGALAYGKLHSLTLREGSSPAQGQAATPGPPEEEQPVTKGSIWSCAAPPPQHTGTLPAVPTSATQDSAAPRPLVAIDPLKWRAVIGTTDLTRSHSHSRSVRVSDIVIQPDFILETFVNDIALFHLRKAVRYNDHIQPICLPFGVFQKLDQNTTCFVSGWGRTQEEGNGTTILQEAKVHFISREICNSDRSYGGVIPNTSFCAGHENGTFDTCRGDSGGPLMCYLPEHKRYFVMGVTSYGHGCGRRHFPGVYSSPSFFQQWLTAYLSQGNTKHLFDMDMMLGQVLMALGSIILLGAT